MGCSLPGFSIHGIFQARILERVAISLEMGQRGSCCDLCQSILFSSLSFIVSDLIFSSLIHFDLIFVYGVRRASQVDSGKELTCQYRRCKRHGFDPWVRKIPWRRAWQPTPVSLHGESHGQRSLVGYSPWGRRVGHDRATHTQSPAYPGIPFLRIQTHPVCLYCNW